MPKILMNGIIARMMFWGALAALGAAGWGLWFLPWIAFIHPLRWAARQSGWKTVFYGGFCLGVAYGGVYCLWFFDLHPLTWLGFSEWGSRLVTLSGWLLLALENGLLLGGLLLAYRALPALWQRLCLFPLLWVAGFALFNSTPLALPWTLIEYTQAAQPAMRWLSGWISASGLAVLLVLHNVLWAECFSSVGDKSRLILALFCPALMSFMGKLPLPAAPVRWPMPVAVIQANIPIEVIRSAHIPAEEIEESYITPLRQTRLPAGTLVSYPEEGVVPGWVLEDLPERNPFMARLWNLACEKNIYIVVGINLLDIETNCHYNALALLPPSPDRHQIRFYRKRRLVPFGEYTPYRMGEALSALLGRWGIDYETSFETGKESPLFSVGKTRLGALICFELIDSLPLKGGFAWKYKTQGADILINASNLGWFHQNRWLESQFLSIAQLRAAETRLPLVLASNTGISALISPMGEILKRTKPSRFSGRHTQVIFYKP